MTPPNPLATHRLADEHIVDAIRTLVDEFWDQEKADYDDQEEEHSGYHPFDALQTLKTWLDSPAPAPPRLVPATPNATQEHTSR